MVIAHQGQSAIDIRAHADELFKGLQQAKVVLARLHRAHAQNLQAAGGDRRRRPAGQVWGLVWQ
jgi:hypothetical protein